MNNGRKFACGQIANWQNRSCKMINFTILLFWSTDLDRPRDPTAATAQPKCSRRATVLVGRAFFGSSLLFACRSVTRPHPRLLGLSLRRQAVAQEAAHGPKWPSSASSAIWWATMRPNPYWRSPDSAWLRPPCLRCWCCSAACPAPSSSLEVCHAEFERTLMFWT